jgi:hypothetical protein
MSARQSTKIELQCEQCGTQFLRPRSELWRTDRPTKGRFCSQACRYAHKSSESLESRLARWSAPPDENGCVLFTGTISIHGYGYITYHKEERMFAHRAAWISRNGPIPCGLCVLHRCDVRACINPDHLFLGTHADNTRDMLDKGRASVGESHHAAKLTEEKVLEILALWATGEHTQKAIGAMFGVTGVLVGLIVRRNAWKHLHDGSVE